MNQIKVHHFAILLIGLGLCLNIAADLVIDGLLILKGLFPFNGVRTTNPCQNCVPPSSYIATPGVIGIQGGSAIIQLLGMSNALQQSMSFTYRFSTPISLANRVFGLTFDYIRSDVAEFSDVYIAIQASTSTTGNTTLPNGDVVAQRLSVGLGHINPPGTTVFIEPRFNPRFSSTAINNVAFLSFTFIYPLNYDRGGQTTLSLSSISLVDIPQP